MATTDRFASFSAFAHQVVAFLKNRLAREKVEVNAQYFVNILRQFSLIKQQQFPVHVGLFLLLGQGLVFPSSDFKV